MNSEAAETFKKTCSETGKFIVSCKKAISGRLKSKNENTETGKWCGKRYSGLSGGVGCTQ